MNYRFATISSLNDELYRASRISRNGQEDEALDIVYDLFDDTLHEGRYSDVDTLLGSLTNCVSIFSSSLLIGILTATLPAKSRLPHRASFFLSVEERLRETGEYTPFLLSGLY
jgi:hypothetical protein